MTHNAHKPNPGTSERRRSVHLALFLCLMSCGVLGLWSQSAPIESDFTFPRFNVSERTDSGIALFNPDAYSASVALALTGPNGQPFPPWGRWPSPRDSCSAALRIAKPRSGSPAQHPGWRRTTRPSMPGELSWTVPMHPTARST